jgi:hypothetical protein
VQARLSEQTPLALSVEMEQAQVAAAALKQFPHDPELHVMALGLLRNIAVGDGNTALVASLGTATLAAATLRSHPSHIGCQTSGLG